MFEVPKLEGLDETLAPRFGDQNRNRILMPKHGLFQRKWFSGLTYPAHKHSVATTKKW